MSVNQRLRFAILERDNFTCKYCKSSDVELQIDHVIPKSLGGADVAENLVTSCASCNRGKASVALGSPKVAQPRRIKIPTDVAIREKSADGISEHEAWRQYISHLVRSFLGRGLTYQEACEKTMRCVGYDVTSIANAIERLPNGSSS